MSATGESVPTASPEAECSNGESLVVESGPELTGLSPTACESMAPASKDALSIVPSTRCASIPSSTGGPTELPGPHEATSNAKTMLLGPPIRVRSRRLFVNANTRGQPYPRGTTGDAICFELEHMFHPRGRVEYMFAHAVRLEVVRRQWINRSADSRRRPARRPR